MKQYINDFIENFILFFCFAVVVVLGLICGVGPLILMSIYNNIWCLLLYLVSVPFFVTTWPAIVIWIRKKNFKR